MRMHRLTTTQLLPVDLETAWRFFSDPRNLQLITPPWLNLVPTSEVPGEMHPGLVVTYRVKPALAISVAWVTEITHVIDRQLVVDEQRAGPYRFWHHQHHFREVPGGTEASHILHYGLPLGLAGDLLGATLVRKRFAEIFEYRRNALDQRFGAGRQTERRHRSAATGGQVLGLT